MPHGAVAPVAPVALDRDSAAPPASSWTLSAVALCDNDDETVCVASCMGSSSNRLCMWARCWLWLVKGVRPNARRAHRVVRPAARRTGPTPLCTREVTWLPDQPVLCACLHAFTRCQGRADNRGLRAGWRVVALALLVHNSCVTTRASAVRAAQGGASRPRCWAGQACRGVAETALADRALLRGWVVEVCVLNSGMPQIGCASRAGAICCSVCVCDSHEGSCWYDSVHMHLANVLLSWTLWPTEALISHKVLTGSSIKVPCLLGDAADTTSHAFQHLPRLQVPALDAPVACDPMALGPNATDASRNVHCLLGPKCQ